MKVEGTYSLLAPRERVWTLLNDPAVLARITPGVKDLTPSGTDTYRATIEVGVGPVKGTYTGQVSITDRTPPERLTLRIEGGGRPGTIRATGELHLEAQGSSTVVRYIGDAQVTGLVASVGHRLMSGVAKQMAGEFFKALEGELTRS